MRSSGGSIEIILNENDSVILLQCFSIFATRIICIIFFKEFQMPKATTKKAAKKSAPKKKAVKKAIKKAK